MLDKESFYEWKKLSLLEDNWLKFAMWHDNKVCAISRYRTFAINQAHAIPINTIRSETLFSSIKRAETEFDELDNIHNELSATLSDEYLKIDKLKSLKHSELFREESREKNKEHVLLLRKIKQEKIKNKRDKK